ncbi:hypothetical protein V2G26_008258 [Clonostachys chloroleuca]
MWAKESSSWAPMSGFPSLPHLATCNPIAWNAMKDRENANRFPEGRLERRAQGERHRAHPRSIQERGNRARQQQNMQREGVVQEKMCPAIASLPRERPDSIVYGREGRLLHDGGCSSWLLAFGPQSDNNKP